MKNVEKKIVKYLTNSASAKDLDYLGEWIQNPKNKEEFKKYIKVHFYGYCNYNDIDTQKITSELLKTIQKEKSILYKLNNSSLFKYGVAATIMLFIAFSYFISTKNNTNKIPSEIITLNKIVPGTDKATLTLSDGSNLLLEKGKSFNSKTLKSDGEKVIYSNVRGENISLAYNYLTIPRGGEFFLKLSDGTKVWLNSESQLKYPENFIDGEERIVELIYGEAYFEVTSSEINKGSKFKVINKSQEINVLGTQFNIKAYKDEEQIYTTLVEGSISLKSDGFQKTLIPEQQSVLDPINRTLSINKVDVYNEIAWKEGIFSFDGKTLKDIMTVLSRWYDFEVEFRDKSIEEEEFVGILEKGQDIEDILRSIKSFEIIGDYSIEGKLIILE